MTIEASTDAAAFYAGIAAKNLAPLWHHAKELLPLEPAPSAVACHWTYSAFREALLAADSLIDPSEAERRVLLLTNPGLAPVVATTPTLLAGVQLLLPGEVARAHRHTAAAVRFIIEGRGASTVTDGERTTMDPGDLVLTPAWTWHDHDSHSDDPVVWLDGLDVPLVRWLEAGFFELHADLRQPVTLPVDYSKRHFLEGTVRPATSWDGPSPSGPSGRRHSPVVNYPWSTAIAALSMLAQEGRREDAEMLTVDYVNPLTRGPVTPTIGCRAHLLPPGATAGRRRETASSIVHVVSGHGMSHVGGVEIGWSEGDVFVVPGWAEVAHTNQSGSSPAMLFAMTDEPALRALDLYRSA